MNTIDLFEKKLRAVARELKELDKRIHQPKSVKLDKPIQKGWKRYYMLTDEAKARPDRELLEEILQRIGPILYHWRPDFRRGKRARVVEIEQKLRNLRSWWVNNRYVYKTWSPYFETIHGYHQRTYHRFKDPHLFRLKTVRNWLTHMWIIDSEAISRSAELERWMDFHQGWPKYSRLKGRGPWKDPRIQRVRDAAKKEDFKQQIRELNPYLLENEMGAPRLRAHFIFQWALSLHNSMSIKTPTIPYPTCIRSKRLSLRSASPQDARFLNRAVKESFPELSRWMPWAKKLPTYEESQFFARKTAAQFIQHQDYGFRIFLTKQRKFVGCIALMPREPEVPSYEIGYWLHSQHTGQGYMTEAVEALVEWARDKVGAKRILIRAQVPNRASWSIPKRLGFRFEGIHRNQVRDNFGKLADMKMYAMTFADNI